MRDSEAGVEYYQTPFQEVEKRFPHGLPLLDPVVDMHIKDDEFRQIVKV